MVLISLLLTLLHFVQILAYHFSFSSSYHHQSVPAECSVRTVKNIMKKCHETGTPWCLGLLEYLCTPLDEKTPSPSSLLSRQFKGLCPIFNHTNSGEGVLENLINRWLNEKLHHDRRSHVPWKIFLQAVQLLCLIIIQTLGLLDMY